jgi:hypothetical protein
MISTNSKLSFTIHTLKQKLTFVSDETTVALTSNNLCYLVEDKVGF